MVVFQPSKLATRVRFPSPAPVKRESKLTEAPPRRRKRSPKATGSEAAGFEGADRRVRRIPVSPDDALDVEVAIKCPDSSAGRALHW
jgi:hypothetical protein